MRNWYGGGQRSHNEITNTLKDVVHVECLNQDWEGLAILPTESIKSFRSFHVLCLRWIEKLQQRKQVSIKTSTEKAQRRKSARLCVKWVWQAYLTSTVRDICTLAVPFPISQSFCCSHDNCFYFQSFSTRAYRNVKLCLSVKQSKQEKKKFLSYQELNSGRFSPLRHIDKTIDCIGLWVSAG